MLRSKAFPTEKATVDSYIYQFLMKENMDNPKSAFDLNH